MKKKKTEAYKGFDKDLKCRDFQYRVGETYEHEGAPNVCKEGFHSCEHPLDVLTYYPAIDDNRYCEVANEGCISRQNGGDSKIASHKITVVAEMKIKGLIEAGIRFVQKSTEPTTGYSAHSATTGDSAHSATTGHSARSATTGYYAHSATTGNYAHSATTGYSAHSATTGDYAHSATTGDYAHSATTGYYAHSATTGYYAHSATTGDYAHSATTGYSAHSATTGYYAHSATTGYSAHSATTGYSAHSATTGNYAHSATTGDYAHSATTGDYAHSATTGKECISFAGGFAGRAKASLGSWVILAEWDTNDRRRIKTVMAAQIDGCKLKPDTWYQLKDECFVEIKE